VTGFIAALAAGCRFDPHVPEATVVCGAHGECPAGLQCVSPRSGSGVPLCCRDSACLGEPAPARGSGGARGTTPPRDARAPEDDVAPITPLDAASAELGTPATADAGPDAGAIGPPPLDAGSAIDLAPVDVRPPEPPPEDSPPLGAAAVLYLRFDDQPPGQTWHDSSGKRNDARLRGGDNQPSVSPGRYDGGLHLGGGPGGGWLEAPSSNTFDEIVHGVSIAAWIYRAPDDGDGTILSRRASSSGGQLYALEIANDRLRARLNSANGYNANLNSGSPVPRGAWVHVAMTFDQHEVRLFVDGVERASQPYLLALPSEVTPVLVGASEAPFGGPTSSRLGATLDEVLLYARPLQDREIAALADHTRPVAR
jgi:hypothetical protein